MKTAAVFTLFSALSLPGAKTDETAVNANPPQSRERSFEKLPAQDQIPTVRSIVPVDGSNVFFLNHRGQVGVAKFTPGLSLIGWEFYSEVKLPSLPFIALGPNYSVLTASPKELTQAFDTNQDVHLDFFQALVKDWPGREEGVSITAGPVADTHGRVLFALSPHPAAPGAPPKARVVAWHPAATRLVIVTESELPISAFSVNRSGLLAARLEMPDYKDGYFLSLTELPPFDPENPDEEPGAMPFTLPSLIIPAELARKKAPTQLCFVRELGKEKILLVCPGSKHLIEIVPEKSGTVWQGAILLRAALPETIETLAEIAPGLILGGGDKGFIPLTDNDAVYRIQRIAIAADGIVLDFNGPVDRFHAVKAENYSVKAISLNGGETNLSVTPVIESDGRSVVLQTTDLKPGTVLRVVCQKLPSEAGENLLSSAAFFTLHRK